MNSKKFLNSLSYALLAQSVALLLSAAMVLLIPKMLGFESFSYWQLFLFYSGYIGFFHFGLNDGIYLKIGGSEIENIDLNNIGSQFKISIIFHSLIALFLGILAIIYIESNERAIVVIGTAICIPIINATSFLGYVFQAVNKTKIFSISIIIEKLFFLMAVICFIFIGFDDFKWILYFYVISKVLSLIYLIWKGRKIVFLKTQFMKKVFKEIFGNIAIGINLMISNISSLLIIGNSRFIVERTWGLNSFSTFSFALLLTSFFLSFLGQVSMILFPALRVVDRAKLREFYLISRDVLGVILPIILLAYMPMYYTLSLWIPQYIESLFYLGLLLPLCTYEGKMNLLCTTYFKVLRKEKLLLKINLLSLFISLSLGVFGAIYLNSLNFVILSILISIAFRSIFSEFYLAKIMGVSIFISMVLETLLVIIFLTGTWVFDPFKGFVLFFISYLLYLLILHKKVSNVLHHSKLFYRVVKTDY